MTLAFPRNPDPAKKRRIVPQKIRRRCAAPSTLCCENDGLPHGETLFHDVDHDQIDLAGSKASRILSHFPGVRGRQNGEIKKLPAEGQS